MDELDVERQLSSGSTQTSVDRRPGTTSDQNSLPDCSLSFRHNQTQSGRRSSFAVATTKRLVAKWNQIGHHIKKICKPSDTEDLGLSPIPQSIPLHKISTSCVTKALPCSRRFQSRISTLRSLDRLSPFIPGMPALLQITSTGTARKARRAVFAGSTARQG